MIRKVLRVLCAYLLAMCIVSAFKSICTPSTNPETATVPSPSAETSIPSQALISTSPDTQQIASPQTVTESSTSLPTPQMIINVTVEEDEHTNSEPINFFALFRRTAPPDITGEVLTELEKRKHFIVRICMRRFCRAYTDREEDNSKWKKSYSHG